MMRDVFDQVSELDRVYGRVSLRKATVVWPAVPLPGLVPRQEPPEPEGPPAAAGCVVVPRKPVGGAGAVCLLSEGP